MIAVACLAALLRRVFLYRDGPRRGSFLRPKAHPTHSRVVTPRPVSVHPIYSRTRGMCGAPGAFFPAKWHPRLRARVVKRWLCRCDARVVKRQKTTHPGRVGGAHPNISSARKCWGPRALLIYTWGAPMISRAARIHGVHSRQRAGVCRAFWKARGRVKG